jgi:hypothetical protein
MSVSTVTHQNSSSETSTTAQTIPTGEESTKMIFILCHYLAFFSIFLDLNNIGRFVAENTY